MVTRRLEEMLDETLAALIAMHPDRIEAADAIFAAECATRMVADEAAEIRPKLDQVRRVALQAAQLWHACLPEERGAISYSPTGLLSVAEGEGNLSVTG